jgi:hypothetical protein
MAQPLPGQLPAYAGTLDCAKKTIANEVAHFFVQNYSNHKLTHKINTIQKRASEVCTKAWPLL